jgi:DNA-binding beta-propeller fold protein YncE
MRTIDFGANPIELEANVTGNIVYVLSANASLRRIVVSGGVVDTAWVGLSPRRMRMLPTELQLWVACREDNSVWVVDLAGFEPDTALQFAEAPSDIAFTSNSEHAFVGLANGGGIYKLNAVSYELEGGLAYSAGPLELDISADDRWLAAADSASGSVRIWNLEQEQFWDVPVGRSARRVRFTQDGKQCYVLSAARGHAFCINLEGAEPLVTDSIFAPATARELALWEALP